MGGETKSSMASTSYPRRAERPVGKLIHQIYEDRLRMFISGGQYEGQSLLAKLYEGRASGKPAVNLSVYSPSNLDRPTFKEATSNTFKPTKVGQSFGPSWSTHWFKIQMTVPEDIRNKQHLEFHWDANNEGLVWTEHGEPLQGLTGGGDRTEWILPNSFLDGKEHIFYIEMACNGMFGNAPGGDSIQPPNPNKYFELREADIVAVNLEARALQIDFWVIGDAAREFPQDSWQEHKALQICNSIMDCFIAGKGSHACIKDCRKIAKEYLTDNVDSSKVYSSNEEALVSGIGHCHIDTCWLWPWAETKRKIARSWANQCDLIDRYPEHRFCASQAQQYKWLEMYYPTLFDRVKTKVKEGTFQPIGGSWVEHDTNLPSGESLVRQFLYGQRFFESHFGDRCTTFWLPDTFGYSAQLPQLCRLAGMSRFFTQKLSWNNINNFPHTTFNWVSLDGSQVICHMCPAETYTAEANFGDLKRSVSQHKSMDQDATSLLVFGKGDGGGGPTWQHLEKLRRCRAISDKVGLLPRLKMGESVDDFFARLEKKAENGTDFVTWYGELYFELHRGTYTTQANNKRNNRKGEILLHDIEYLATVASIKDYIENAKSKKSHYTYPKKEIDEMWENVLLCQFHDCLPGSSIEMCYDDSDKLYAKVFKTGEKLLANAMSYLGFDSIRSGKGDPVAINTLPWPRSEIFKLPPNISHQHAQSEYAILSGGPGLCDVKLQDNLKDFSSSIQPATVKEVNSGVFQLENALFRLEILGGIITSLYDKKAEREVLPPGAKANQLVLFDDKPLYWQAWDVELYHLESREELKPHKTSIIETGPARVSVVVETRISSSSWARTTVALTATPSDLPNHNDHQSYVEIASEVEWREEKKFLKVEFPVDVRNTEASYETQFGIMRRPTHYNTSWDMAKFEVCCHKWADLSESNYGVSILNDSKYGFATEGNVMRLSLIRAPKAPDAHADMGRHHIRYAIFPHQGALDHRTVRAAFSLNNPISSPHAGSADEEPQPLFPFQSRSNTPYLVRHSSPASVAALLSAIALTPSLNPAIVIDTIKRGEDDVDVSRGELPKRKGRSIIVRMYDALGGRVTGRLVWGGLPVEKVTRCNLLEDDEVELKIEEGVDAKGEGKVSGVGVVVKAFEVMTVRLWLE